jgi:peptide chain release factor 2
VAIKKKISSLRDDINMIESLRTEMEEIEEFFQLEMDDNLQKEIEQKIKKLKEKVEKKETLIYLSGKWDQKDAILEIRSGAGGRDAEDWAALLLRMYKRFCKNKGFSFKTIDSSYGEGGGPEGQIGLKKGTIKIRGDYAYGQLKNETGVHRLVRISPFSEKDLRHTSFAKVEVIPDFKEGSSEVKIDSEDLKIDTFRASGPGGQHVNRRETAVRITHKPTGVVVSSQSERSHGKNKEEALSVLKSKLFQLKEKQRKKKIEDVKDDSSASWGNQIRNYVFHPYQLVKDTRTGVETSNIESVLEGDLDEFIKAEIMLD